MLELLDIVILTSNWSQDNFFGSEYHYHINITNAHKCFLNVIFNGVAFYVQKYLKYRFSF